MKRLVLSAMTVVALSGTLAAAEVDYRQRLEQARVAQGIRTGSLSPAEAARIESQEAAVRHEINRDRFFHNGRLTPAESRRINRQENALSNEIYRFKHNGR